MIRSHRAKATETGGRAEHVFDRPANVRRVLVLLYVVCALLLLADFVVQRHVEHPLEILPGFYAVFGFIGCVSLVIAARELRRLVMRPQDYYDG